MKAKEKKRKKRTSSLSLFPFYSVSSHFCQLECTLNIWTVPAAAVAAGVSQHSMRIGINEKRKHMRQGNMY